jgi:hypothetical protein
MDTTQHDALMALVEDAKTDPAKVIAEALHALKVTRAWCEDFTDGEKAALTAAIDAVEDMERNLSLRRLAALTPDQIDQSYEGRAGQCACGCSGTHYTDAAKCAAGLARMQRRARKDPSSVGYYRYNDGSENWNYETKSNLFILNTKKA